MAAPAFAFTISRAAEILGEDEQLLWHLADDMDPEDGRLWIYDTGEEQTIAFTPAGIEYLHTCDSCSRSTNSIGHPPRS